VHRPQAGKEVAEVAAEVREHRFVGVEAEKRPRRFDAQHLAVGQHRRRAAPAQPVEVAALPRRVVHQAEHGDDKALDVHARDAPGQHAPGKLGTGPRPQTRRPKTRTPR